MTACVASAQVKITYTDIPPQSSGGNDENLTDYELNSIQIRRAPLVEVTDDANNETLKYGWVDFDFICESIQPMREFINQQVNEMNMELEPFNQKINQALTDTEKEGIRKEAYPIQSAWGDKIIKYAFSFIIQASVELGYIPLPLHFKELSQGKILDCHDITWEICNKIKNDSLRAFSNTLPGTPFIKIGIVNFNIILDKIGRNNDAELRIPQYNKKAFDDEITKLSSTFISSFNTAVTSACRSAELEGALFVGDTNYEFPPVIQKEMNDITYPVYKELLPAIEEYQHNYIRLLERYVQ